MLYSRSGPSTGVLVVDSVCHHVFSQQGHTMYLISVSSCIQPARPHIPCSQLSVCTAQNGDGMCNAGSARAPKHHNQQCTQPFTLQSVLCSLTADYGTACTQYQAVTLPTALFAPACILHQPGCGITLLAAPWLSFVCTGSLHAGLRRWSADRTADCIEQCQCKAGAASVLATPSSNCPPCPPAPPSFDDRQVMTGSL